MKKTKLIAAVALISVSALSFQSCIGSFSLTNKVLTWNRQVSNKFVNELVFFAFWVLPVYEVTAAADLLVINSIEFWSGNQPLESNNRTIETDQGKYLIASGSEGYEIKSPNGDVMRFHFDSEKQMWSFSKNNSESIDFMQFEDETHVKILSSENEFVDVELSSEGIENFKNNALMPFMALN